MSRILTLGITGTALTMLLLLVFALVTLSAAGAEEKELTIEQQCRDTLKDADVHWSTLEDNVNTCVDAVNKEVGTVDDVVSMITSVDTTLTLNFMGNAYKNAGITILKKTPEPTPTPERAQSQVRSDSPAVTPTPPDDDDVEAQSDPPVQRDNVLRDNPPQDNDGAAVKDKTTKDGPVAQQEPTPNPRTDPHVNVACTKGPGPDPYNPTSPCGQTYPGSDDPNYTNIWLHTPDQLGNPDAPRNLTLTPDDATDTNETDFALNWFGHNPSGTQRVRLVGLDDDGNPRYYEREFGGHVYHAYLWAWWEQDTVNTTTTCTTKRTQEDTWQALTSADLDTTQDPPPIKADRHVEVSLATPDTIPSGCQLRMWMVSVHIIRDSDESHSSSELLFMDPVPGQAIR